MNHHGCARIAGLILIAIAFAAPGVEAQAGGISGIVSFGDSLSDTGNTYLAAGFPPSPPYAPGRYSDGPVWLEYLAARLGVAAPTPSLVPGGTNYAWGGAQTGGGLSFMGTPNVDLQIATYLATNTPASSQLFTLWAGANDFLNAGQTNPLVPLANIAKSITTLASAGAGMFLVPNLPLLGNLPATNTLPQLVRDSLNLLSSTFDTLLSTQLDQLEQILGVKIFRLDINGLVQDAINNPAKYGFIDVTNQGKGQPNGGDYLFWDEVHPTTKAHKIIGGLAFASVVPEPSSLVLLLSASGLILIGARLRRVTSKD